MQSIDADFGRVNQGFDRLYIVSDRDISQYLSNISGIAYFGRVEKLDFDNLEDMVEYGYEFFQSKLR